MSMVQLKPDMGVHQPIAAASYGDYIVARLKLDRRSQRWLASETGISQSRMNRLLHGDPLQRKPLRLDEKARIFSVLKIDDHTATLATELMGTSPAEEFETNIKIADMLSVMIRGLAPEVATALRHIDGFESSDILPAYGNCLKAAIVRLIQSDCADAARRRGMRLDELFASEVRRHLGHRP